MTLYDRPMIGVNRLEGPEAESPVKVTIGDVWFYSKSISLMRTSGWDSDGRSDELSIADTSEIESELKTALLVIPVDVTIEFEDIVIRGEIDKFEFPCALWARLRNVVYSLPCEPDPEPPKPFRYP